MNTVALKHHRALHRRRPDSTPYGRYALASLGLMMIASANGAIRELTYGEELSETTAHRLSLVPMVVLFTLYVHLLERRWPLRSRRAAAAVGLIWAVIAAGFDLGLGHFVEDKSWSTLLDLDLAVVVGWSAVVPSVARLLGRRTTERRL